MKNRAIQTTRGIRREKSEYVVGVKLNPSLIAAIDQEAKEMGLTRSGVIRIHLISVYRDRLPK